MGAVFSRSNPGPWERLQRPARVTMLGLNHIFPKQLLWDIARYQNPRPNIHVEVGLREVATETLQRGLLTITKFEGGCAQPLCCTRHGQDVVRTNADAVIYVVSGHENSDLRWQYEDLECYVLDILDFRSRRIPLLFLVTAPPTSDVPKCFEIARDSLLPTLKKFQLSPDTYSFIEAPLDQADGWRAGLDWLVDQLNSRDPVDTAYY